MADGDRSALPQLVDRLEDEDPAVRFAAILALEKLTGRRLGYAYGRPSAVAVAKWRRFVSSTRSSPPASSSAETR